MPNSFHQQHGLSLIELLVAMLISSFLIIGVTQIYIDNKRNYLYQQGQGENQENGRFALMFLEGQLSKAGYRRDPRSDMSSAFPAATVNNCTFAAGQVVVRVDDESICLRYQPRDENETDCEGNTFSGSSSLSEPYAETFNTSENIVEKITYEDGELRCNDQSLVTGLQAIYFDFGVNDDADTKAVTSYKPAPAAADFIRSLRYSLLLTATQSNLAQGIESKLCENSANTDDMGDWEKLTGQELDCDDDKLYQMVSGSTTLRNLMP
ncbi:PilW family protein [Pseudomonas sp. LRF_L74]|uniref:PilW family protein n=1 Tax=Pseudomonas sp. LRF_L74 TaxID=3369422 RepID=UPI003F626666